MISTDTYPDLDESRVQALFAAARQAVADAHAAMARSAGGVSAMEMAAELPLARFLPRKYLPRYTPEFFQRFAVTVTTVAWKLADPEHVFGLACTAEDLALKYILDAARGGAAEDPQWDELTDALFDDDAFLVLWDPAQDGSEERYLGAANLAFAEWFEPFGERQPVHPFLQREAEAFKALWSEAPAVDDELEDPVTEVFIALGEDWLDVPDQVADQIPSILEEARAVLFPDAPRRLSSDDRERLYESAAEDARVLLEIARNEVGVTYDVWLLRDVGPGRPAKRERLHSGLPLEDALNMRKLERMGEYRGVVDVRLRVYPQDHGFEGTERS
jgi:hypothetical protein